LADFDWAFQPSVPRAKVEELATLRFMEEAHNVLLVGSPGVGNYAGERIMLRNGLPPQVMRSRQPRPFA